MPRGRGWAAITAGQLYYGGRIGAGSLHSHYAAQLLIGDGLVLRGADGVEHAMSAALIPANTPHAIATGTADGLLALMDPAQMGRLRHRQPAGTAVDSAACWRIDARPPARCDLPTLAALVDDLVGAVPRRPTHPGLCQALRTIDETLPGPVRLTAVAAAAHLSESRLSHVFREELGLPFRPYVLWARLRAALSALSRGASLTEAAHTAGFADAAHLTRTVRTMMGDAPSALAAGVHWITFDRQPG
ncbi:MAG: helix-turn-helix transcriptional regulator [Catenulispora sp.]|nr:helix-turn-helix transcriptional regulator [Catenulispora sp.]